MQTLEFRAMGCQARIVADGVGIDAVAECRAFIDELEQRWSRFLPDSEISQINRQPGNLHLVSALTAELITRAIHAQTQTDGLFNPLMLRQLEELGYERSWAESCPHPSGAPSEPAGIDQLEWFPEIAAVRLPQGTRFDPGGIGKGLAADLATEFLITRGATTSSVELGGDLRVHGTPWYGDSWRIGVVHPFDDDAEVAAFTPDDGAVTTSSTLGRRWQVGDAVFHHLLDPRTGRPAGTDLVTVSTCADTAAWAEVAAKVALIKGSGQAVETFDALGVAGVAITADGTVISSGNRQRAERQEVMT